MWPFCWHFKQIITSSEHICFLLLKEREIVKAQESFMEVSTLFPSKASSVDDHIVLTTFTSGFSTVQQVPGWTEDGVWLGDAKNRHTGIFGGDSSTPVLVIVVNRFLLLRQREAAGVPRF